MPSWAREQRLCRARLPILGLAPPVGGDTLRLKVPAFVILGVRQTDLGSDTNSVPSCWLGHCRRVTYPLQTSISLSVKWA